MDKNQGTSESTDSSDSKTEETGCEDDSSTSTQVAGPSNGKVGVVGVACDFTDTVSIRVKDKYFNVPRNLLVTNSTFFDDALSGSEPPKFFLVLDDIDADIFNFFINVLLESSCSTTYKMSARNASRCGRGPPSLLRLWKLSNRFNNNRICLLVEESLRTQYFDKCTPEVWESWYVQRTEDWVRRQLLVLQRCYKTCKDESIPFEKDLVTMCANCPGQVVAAHFDQLDLDFKAEVVKSFATRVADPKVAQRKRDHEDDGEFKVSKKNRL